MDAKMAETERPSLMPAPDTFHAPRTALSHAKPSVSIVDCTVSSAAAQTLLAMANNFLPLGTASRAPWGCAMWMRATDSHQSSSTNALALASGSSPSTTRVCALGGAAQVEQG